MNADPFDEDDFDDLGLPTLEPKDMGNAELADALAALARGLRGTLDAAARSLFDEAGHRLRVQGWLRASLTDRCEQVRRLEAELQRLRGGPPVEGVAAVGEWRRWWG